MKPKNKTRVCLFIRVSTHEQDYQRQHLELCKYCDERGFVIKKVIATKISGMKKYDDRPDLKELFLSATQGVYDKVLVTEVSRLGRDVNQIRKVIDHLHSNGIAVVFKNLSGLESIDENGQESFVTNTIINIYSEMAAEERRVLKQRIQSGLASARQKGIKLGRPKGSITDRSEFLKKYSKLASDLRTGTSVRKCMKLHDVSGNTVLKVKKMMSLRKQAA